VIGKVQIIEVPLPTSDCICALPFIPIALSCIFFNPLPGCKLLVLNPVPLSRIDKQIGLLLADKEIVASVALLYFAILLIASLDISIIFFLSSCLLQTASAFLHIR